MPTLTEILDAGSAACEKFVAESTAMDWAWKAGKLDEWMAQRLEAKMKEFNGSDSGANPQA